MRMVMNGKRVQELREDKGLSKQALAEAAGINRGTVRRIEREEPIRVKTAKKVGAALEVNLRTIGQPYYEPERAAIMGAVAAEFHLERLQRA